MSELNIERDVSVYNEATGWTLHSMSLGGVEREDIAEDFKKATLDGLLLPIELVQDDPLNVRVISRVLTEEEENEWVGKIVGKLRIPDGVLVVEGGFDEDGLDEEYCQTVEVPPGDYKVEVYTCFWSINGEYVLQAAKLYEPIGAWFRRTYPDQETLPPLLQVYLAENSEEDPGHEKHWDEFYDSDALEDLEEELTDLVDFIVRLTPWQATDEMDLSFDKEDGWLLLEHGARKPKRCPVGLKFNGEEDEDDED